MSFVFAVNWKVHCIGSAKISNEVAAQFAFT